MIAIRHERRIRTPCSDRHAGASATGRSAPAGSRQWCSNPAKGSVSHSVGQPSQFETCRSCHRSLSQKRFPKNKATRKGKPEKVGPFWKSIDIQSLVSTCRMHEVNPYTCGSTCCNGSTHPARDVAQLMPRLWKKNFAANPLTSDIGKGVLQPAIKSRGLGVKY